MLRMKTWAINVHIVQSFELRQLVSACKLPISTGGAKAAGVQRFGQRSGRVIASVRAAIDDKRRSASAGLHEFELAR